jgi:thiamine transporter
LACVFIVALRRGTIDGVLTGLIMGLLNMAGGVYSIADVWWKVFFQIALDYWLAYPLAGFAGLLHKKIAEAPDQKKMNLYIVLGCLLGGFLKFMAHYLSGILFWPGDPWNVGGSYIYSALYNLAYTAPCTILSMAVVIILATKMPNLFVNPDSYSFKRQKAEAVSQEQKADKSDGEKPASEEKKGE